MAKATFALTDFTGGEFSPYIDARITAERYQTGLTECINAYPTPQGPLLRRPGTRHVHTTKDNGAARLIPFQFSIDQTYHIEFGDQYARFYRNNGLILETTKAVTAVSQSSTTVLTSAGHGYSNGDRIYLAGLVDDDTLNSLEQLNNREYVLANVTTDTFEIQIPPSTAIDSSGMGMYVSGGVVGRIYEIVTPYAIADVPLIAFDQSHDVLYLVHPDYQPRKMLRVGDTSWTIPVVDFLNGPYLPTNTTTTTFTPSGAGPGSVTVTASSTTGINDDAGFQSSDVGREIRLQGSTLDWVEGTISAVGSTTSITVVLATALPNTTAITSWRLGVWSETTGYPRVVTFFEDRLWMGGVTAAPQRVDSSRTGDYENFQPTDADGTVGDDHACSFTLNSGDVNLLLWLKARSGSLYAGTPKGEWAIMSAYESEPITPTSVFVDDFADWGSHPVAPVKAGKSLLYIHRSKRRLREITGDRGAATVFDMSELAYHLAAGGFEEVVYVQDPHQIVWVRKTDGALVGLTYGRNEGGSVVAGWHRHSLGGGTVVGQDTKGNDLYATVESVSAAFSVSTSRDELWMIVKRTINGGTVRHVEYMEQPFDEEVSYTDAHHLDGATKFSSGSDITELTGLAKWEGETLNTWINGAAGPDIVIANGRATLSGTLAARTVYVGYKTTMRATILRPEAGGANGPALGKLRRVHEVAMNFYRTLGVQVSFYEVTDWDDLSMTGADGFSGIIKVDLPSDNNYEGRISWRQTGPGPGMVRSVTGFLLTQDDG